MLALTNSRLTEISRYTCLALGLLSVFYGLHYLGNQIPDSLSFTRVHEGFRAGNLIAETDYPTTLYGTRSLESLVGENQFSDCRMLLSVLAPPSTSIRDVIVPQRLSGRQMTYCRRAHDIVTNGSRDGGTAALNLRYWHGTKALMAIGLMVTDVFVLTNGIKTLTYFAYTLLALVALWISTRLLIVLSPFIILGFFFSGILYYGGFAYSLPYLFALLALTGVALFMKFKLSRATLARLFFALGMASSYLFLLDGHLLLLLPASVVILYFGHGNRMGLRNWWVLASRCIGMFVIGFSISLAVNQVGKAYYIGSSVFEGFIGQLGVRMSIPELGYGDVLADTAMALAGPFTVGFRDVGTAGSMGVMFAMVGCCWVALLASVGVWVMRWYRQREIEIVVGVIVVVVAAAMVVVRVVFLLEHTNAHTFFIGRYMFVPMALCWMMLLATLLALRDGSSETWVRLQAMKGRSPRRPDG